VGGGAALWAGEDGTLELSPRVYRMTCANGVLVRGGTLAFRALEPGAGHAAVRELLGRRVLEEEIQPLRAAAAFPVDEELALEELAIAMQQQSADDRRTLASVGRLARMQAEFVRAGDLMAWGLINAITAV